MSRKFIGVGALPYPTAKRGVTGVAVVKIKCSGGVSGEWYFYGRGVVAAVYSAVFNFIVR